MDRMRDRMERGNEGRSESGWGDRSIECREGKFVIYD